MQTVFTRMLSAAYSLASDLVRLRPAARVTVVGSERAGGVLPPTVVMFTMRPPPRFFMWGMTRRDMRTAPMTLSSQSDLQASSGTFSQPAGRRRSARVVQEDIHAAPLGDHRVDQPLAVRRAANVGDLGQHLAPRGLADLVRGLVQDLLAARADGYPGALRGELLGGGATEPLAPARADGDLPVQTELEHDRILLAGLSIGAGAPGPHPNTSRVRSGAGTAGRFTLLYIRHTRRSYPCGMLIHDGTAAVALTQAVRGA